MQWWNTYRRWSWLFLIVPIYLFLFVKLGDFHIRLWDEGWFVVHAYEMLEKGSWLVPFYDGYEVHYGTKPPIQTWLQMIAISLWGYDELSVRLPSAMASAGIVLLVFFWARKNLNETAAWIAALTLLTMDGFVHFHAARGAEADALLTLSMMVQLWFFWEWIKYDRLRDLIGLGAFIAISFWVKSVAGYMLLPAFLIYTALYERDRLVVLMKQPKVYVVLITGISVGVSYMFIRELAQPGYIDFMMERQAGRIMVDVGHDEPWDYYFKQFWDERLTYFLPLALIGVVFPFIDGKERKQPALFIALSSLFYFALISAARSKLVWYALPLYPLLAILIAYWLSKLLQQASKIQQLLFLSLALSLPAWLMFEKTQRNRIDEWSRIYELEEQYLFEVYNQGRNMDGLNVIHDHFDGALLFYKYKFKERGQHINLQNNIDLKVGEWGMVNSDAQKKELAQAYELDTLDGMESVVVFRVTALKAPADSSQNGQIDFIESPIE
jgi:4-amino-4-deoxy-L-arabinose transferase-like glycosyltransferase